MVAGGLRRVATTGLEGPARRWLSGAWVALALTPLGLLLAMVVGEGLLAAQGYQVGAALAAPVGATLLAAVPAMLVGAAPPAAAVWCGLRARRLGHRQGLLVAVAGAVLGVGFVVVNVAAAMVGR